jgi:hypothetical protein
MNIRKIGIMLDTMESTLPSENTEEEQKQTKIVPFSLIGGSKGGGDWLSELPIGCNFLAKSTQSQIDLFEYWILGKGERAVKIVLVQHNDEKHYWVDPKEFSKVMTLYEIISN